MKKIKNKELLEKAGFGVEVLRREAGLCPVCSTPIKENEFRTELDRKEHSISGMCQSCIDRVFSPEEEE